MQSEMQKWFLLRRLRPELFSKKSYVETSLKEIAEATNLSKGCIFHYFSTKDEVLFSMLNRFMSEGVEEIRRQLQELKSPDLKILCLIRHTINHYIEKPAEAKTLFRDYRLLSSQHLQTIKEKERSYVAMAKEALKELLGPAFSSDLLTVAALLLMGMCGWAFSWYDPRGSLGADELTEMMYSIFLRGIESYSKQTKPTTRRQGGSPVRAIEQFGSMKAI